MENFRIQFSSVDSIAEFVRIMEKAPVKAYVRDENHQLSATSLLGLMSMDLYRPYELIFRDEENTHADIMTELNDYRVKV